MGSLRMGGLVAAIALALGAGPAAPEKVTELWALKPVVRPDVPAGLTDSPNPIDAFVAAELTGYRSTGRTQMEAVGIRNRIEPRPDDLFALGFLARGAVTRDGANHPELAIAAVETVSTAFMGMTVGCAKCHDHMYDPIKKRDFYAMKALFDPLVLKKVLLATPAEMFASGKTQAESQRQRQEIQKPLDDLVGPYK